MTERAYTITEIDAMRRDVRALYGVKDVHSTEEYLRTLMLAGIDPAELNTQAELARAKIREHLERRKADLEKRRAAYVEATGDPEPTDRHEARLWFRRFTTWLMERRSNG